MFSDVGDKLNEQIKGMLEKPILNLDPKPYHLAKSLYQSCMDTANIESRGIQPLLSIMKAMGGWPLLEGPSWEQEQGGNFRFEMKNFSKLFKKEDPRRDKIIIYFFGY